MSTTLPDHLRTLGGQLDEAWMHRYGAPPRRKSVARAKLVAASVVLAGAAALAVALFGRTTGPGAVEQALAAVGSAPGGTIVHLTSISRDDRGVTVERAELWGTTTPPFARRWILRAGDGEPIEQGARADEYTQYDPAGIVYVRTLDGGIAEGTRPADFAADAARLKSYLRDGHARDAGEVTVDGTIRRRFVITPPGGGTCTYDVQPQTFVGVSLTCAGTPSGPHGPDMGVPAPSRQRAAALGHGAAPVRARRPCSDRAVRPGAPHGSDAALRGVVAGRVRCGR